MEKNKPESLFDSGNRCEWMGQKVSEMDRKKLIEFIGNLDAFITNPPKRHNNANN